MITHQQAVQRSAQRPEANEGDAPSALLTGPRSGRGAQRPEANEGDALAKRENEGQTISVLNARRRMKEMHTLPTRAQSISQHVLNARRRMKEMHVHGHDAGELLLLCSTPGGE